MLSDEIVAADQQNRRGKSPPAGAHTTLRRWLWRSFLKTAIFPLLFIELGFLGIFLASSAVVYRENVAAQRDVARDYLDDVAEREAGNISATLAGVARNTRIFTEQTERALIGNFQPSASEKARHAWSPEGAFYSRTDNGTAASYFSAYKPITPAQLATVWKLSSLDPLMMDMKNSDPMVVSIYVNTSDNYNRIYPYFEVLEQYPQNMRISEYNFYYMADAAHNPQRQAVWTNAYADPAGHGWMISSIAPVWLDNQLRAVVGQDVALGTITQRLHDLNLPWGAFAMLVDADGRIIAMPPAGERLFKLKELTSLTHADTITSDRFKPESFNLAKRADTRVLADTLRAARAGRVRLELGGGQLASFARIAGPEWSLVVVAPERQIFANSIRIRNRQQRVGGTMAGMLVMFYIAFFAFLYGRANRMSISMARPIGQLSQLLRRIGQGEYRQHFSGTQISEIDELGHQLVETGRQLGAAHQTIVEQQKTVASALRRHLLANEEQSRFLRVMSHEIRTPLAIIDSGAQILDRKADQLRPDDVRDRASRMRRAVERVSRLLQKLGQSIERDETGQVPASGGTSDVEQLVTCVAAEVVPADRLRLEVAGNGAQVAEGPPLAVALRATLDNAVRYSIPDGPITVKLELYDNEAAITVSDSGPGIPAAELDHVGERFFRGSNAATTDGAGVGIYVARKLMESAGGSLTVASTTSGTQAIHRLPLAPESVTVSEEVSG
ncbi:MAG: hypothetical protein RLZZ08_1680 [Pseudomonadota bacterium]